MVIDLGNAGPMVKLAVALLDDEDGQGITEEALTALKNLEPIRTSSDMEFIFSRVKGTDGRCYLREGWNDE